jgi:hypothetical protein
MHRKTVVAAALGMLAFGLAPRRAQTPDPYVIDELNGGSIYRFVPTRRGDLSDGQLYALKLTELSDAEQKWDEATYSEKGRKLQLGATRHDPRGH